MSAYIAEFSYTICGLPHIRSQLVFDCVDLLILAIHDNDLQRLKVEAILREGESRGSFSPSLMVVHCRQ
jgi:hypothetical protein